MAYINIDVDLDEFNIDDIILHVNKTVIDFKQRSVPDLKDINIKILDILTDQHIPIYNMEGISLMDKQKLETFISKIDKFTIEEIENR